jgi:hypothetical protein
MNRGGQGATDTSAAPRRISPSAAGKETGNGHREAGHAALDSYTEWRSICVDFSGRLQRAQIDNQESLE